jgi:aspartate oxidase
MWEKAGLVRTADGLREGLQEVYALEEEIRGTALCRLLPVVRTMLEGALVDRRSRGCHYRLDAEEEVVFADLPG